MGVSESAGEGEEHEYQLEGDVYCAELIGQTIPDIEDTEPRMNSWRILIGDVREQLATLPAGCVRTCVTSPPYWGLRDYGVSGQLGLESTPDAYVAAMVGVFREVRRVLSDDGTVFLNLGDSYFGGGRGGGGSFDSERRGWRAIPYDISGKEPEGSRANDCLCGNLCGVCLEVYRRTTRNGPVLGAMLRASLRGSSLERIGSAFDHLPTSDSLGQVGRSVDASSDRADRTALEPERLRASLASMLGESDPLLLDECLRRASSCECLLCARSSSGCVPVFSGRAACNCGTAVGASEARMIDTDVSGSAHRYFTSIKTKDLVGIPWAVAFALRADGWYLRSDIIWSKPNPMPESVTDRPTKAHEYIFLLSKSRSYYYDAEAIAEAASDTGGAQRWRGVFDPSKQHKETAMKDAGIKGGNSGTVAQRYGSTRNRRSVWSVATQPYADAHFATFPEDLIEPCILAGSAIGDTVLDPFTGSGTTGAVAIRHQRNFIGCELNPAYVELARKRIGNVAPMFASEVA